MSSWRGWSAGSSRRDARAARGLVYSGSGRCLSDAPRASRGSEQRPAEAGPCLLHSPGQDADQRVKTRGKEERTTEAHDRCKGRKSGGASPGRRAPRKKARGEQAGREAGQARGNEGGEARGEHAVRKRPRRRRRQKERDRNGAERVGEQERAGSGERASQGVTQQAARSWRIEEQSGESGSSIGTT